MNIYANRLFKEDPIFIKEINKIAKSWFRKFKGQYNRDNLFEVEDLEQEIWVELFDSSLKEKTDFIDEAERVCNKHRMRGDRRPVEIPISQLGKDERRLMENIFYGISEEEDSYDEESFP